MCTLDQIAGDGQRPSDGAIRTMPEVAWLFAGHGGVLGV